LVDQIGAIIERYYNDNQYRMVGSTVVVQVDETKLNFNCKSHRGRENREPVWALVIVDISTTPASGFAEIVVDRTKRTLLVLLIELFAQDNNTTPKIGLHTGNLEMKTTILPV
jgi:hypothetical protein